MKDCALAGRCGLYCGSCAVYRAYKDGGDFKKRFSKEWELPIDEVRCEGCHALTMECRGFGCEIVRCTSSKGFEFCFECPECSRGGCKNHKTVAENAAKYGIDLRSNLERIRAEGMEAWLSESKERFKCPSCGKPLPSLLRTESKCYHCNSSLDAANGTPREGRKRKGKV